MSEAARPSVEARAPRDDPRPVRGGGDSAVASPRLPIDLAPLSPRIMRRRRKVEETPR